MLVRLITLFGCICISVSQAAEKPWLTYKGVAGPGKGKNIVFVTGDEEYRSEESMPAMARILAQRHGFHCTVLFAVDPKSGEIDPKIDNNIPGLEALKKADLMVVFTRFRHLPEDQMAMFVDYVNSGRPVIGVRTATHAFDYDKFQSDRFSEWGWRGPSKTFAGGFGRQVLGETWIDHYGGYHSQSTVGILMPEMKNHPILRGVESIWGLSHAYKVTQLEGDSVPLVMGQPLVGLKPDDKPDTEKQPVPIAWTKTFTGTAGKPARVFTTTLGYGDDFKDEGIRRMFVNASYWCTGLEEQIPAKSDVTHVGTYNPGKSDFGAYQTKIKPTSLAQNVNTDDLAELVANEREPEYYSITDIPLPPAAVVEPASILSLPDGRLVVGTRRGEIYFATGCETTPPIPKWSLFASGLTEIFGLAWKDETLFVTQQSEITRILDSDKDGKADRFETVSDAWGWSGEHEYTFGSNGFDKDGAIWTTHCLTGSYTSDVPFRGWALRHFPDGRFEAMCCGLRSPAGISFNAEGDAFYAENQGPWNGSCSLKHLKPGGFMGHPISFPWYKLAPNMGPCPAEPTNTHDARYYLDAARIPQLVPPAVIFPYKKMGQCSTAMMLDKSAGKFGPFAGQMFVADYTLSQVMRADLEKVGGVYQGACFPFRQGLSTGIIGGTLTNKGQLFVGGSKRGWPVRGLAENALQRIDWTGKVPCEIKTMHITHDGFLLTFTSPVDPVTASNPESYTLETYTHHYHSEYGSPEIDQAEQTITAVKVSDDRESVRLVVDKLVLGHVHELHATGVQDQVGKPLLHDVGYYTVNRIPVLPTEYTNRNIEGWNIRIDNRLLTGEGASTGSEALRVLQAKLVDITTVVPKIPLQKLKQVTIELDFDYYPLVPMQYHGGSTWLEWHGYHKQLANCVHIPVVKDFLEPNGMRRMPWVILHELSHAYHDQVLGYDEPRVKAAWLEFCKSGKYKSVLTSGGEQREHYGLTNEMEFFAEMTEAYFGSNDFFPFVAGELKNEEPAIYALMEEIWGKLL